MKNFLTKTSHKIIAFLAVHPNQQFFISEIAKKSKVSLGSAHQTLKKLKKQKLVFSEKKGRMVFYQINSHHPLIKQIKTTNIVSQLITLVDKLKEECLQVILFGSTARGENDLDSDIDLFVLTHTPEIVREILSENNKRLPIAPVIKTPNQWFELERKEPEFYQEVKRGIILNQKDE